MKEQEGDPRSGAHPRRPAEMSRRRMMSNVPHRRRGGHQPDPLRGGPRYDLDKAGAPSWWPRGLNAIAMNIASSPATTTCPSPRRRRWPGAPRPLRARQMIPAGALHHRRRGDGLGDAAQPLAGRGGLPPEEPTRA